MSRSLKLTLALLLLAGSLAFLLYRLRETVIVPSSLAPLPPAWPANALVLDPPRTDIVIPIAPLVELDGMRRDEVYTVRRQSIAAYDELLQGGRYQPSDDVFGQIDDGRRWWGIHGIYFFGPGPRSHEGPAEESRFLANPLLLVGLCEIHSWVARDREPFALFPRPQELIFFPAGKHLVQVRYDVGRFFRALEAMRYAGAARHELGLIAYNARDLGLPFLALDRARSKNVLAPPSHIIAIQQYIHRGGSCGQPAGCNNMSPAQPELDIRVPQLPAKLHLRLYRTQPSSADTPGDLEYVIFME